MTTICVTTALPPRANTVSAFAIEEKKKKDQRERERENRAYFYYVATYLAIDTSDIQYLRNVVIRIN